MHIAPAILIYALDYRTNAANWENRTMPSAGSIAVFPESIKTFGSDTCTGTTHCEKGALISVKPAVGSSQLFISLSQLAVPSTGGLFLGSGVTISFEEPAEGQELTTATWADTTDIQGTDFLCADNWLISGTTENLFFQVPCYFDTVVFDGHHGYMVDIANNVFVNNMSLTNGATFNPFEFTGSMYNTNPSMCPDLYSDAVGLQYCQALCINTCPLLDPNLGSVNSTQRRLNDTNLILDSLNNAIGFTDRHGTFFGQYCFGIHQKYCIAWIWIHYE